ncbi:Crp/Fnr family transcriptional regulator [Rummeliibacillus suwonensis]|uniref:Crp/Fnr family transcriptional regulator n=1 Tax=Rummeliibacillus suwonensis TaxID=1306154 RepID=UPI001FBB0F8E|nr:Crp/Fnr family transcriptional regulator [Rummeliibacillus suwonensis]
MDILKVHQFFPFFESPTIAFIQKAIPKDTVIFNEGDECGTVAFLLSGSIRISKIGKNGREIVLYRLGSGDSCILTISSVLANISYPATAVVEEDAEVILLSIQQFKELMTINPEFQQYIYKLLAARLLEVMTLVDEIVFHKMDERLIEYLLRHSKNDEDIIEITHEELASQLGSVREVISRLLKGFERDGLIQLSRGKVKIMHRSGLEEKLSSY